MRSVSRRKAGERLLRNTGPRSLRCDGVGAERTPPETLRYDPDHADRNAAEIGPAADVTTFSRDYPDIKLKIVIVTA